MNLMDSEDRRNTSIGYMNFAESYHRCASKLASEKQNGELSLPFDAPIYYLYAHAMELALKSLLLETGASISEAEKYRHNIEKLYNELKMNSATKLHIEETEKHCRKFWRDLLRRARDSHQEKLVFLLTDQSDPEGFGILNNEDFKGELPELREAIVWIDKHHAKKGGQFRYLKTGLQSRPTIKAFGLRENVVLRSLDIAFSHIHSQALQRYRSKRKHPGHF